jgi:hypothetical protein
MKGGDLMLERGRPVIPEDEHVLQNGFTKPQWKRLQNEARKKKLSAAYLVRQIIDWYFAAIDSNSTVIPSIQSDNEFEKLVSEFKNKE